MKLDGKLAESIGAIAEKGKKKKSLTYEEVIEELQSLELEPEQIDDIFEHLQTLGITISPENEEAEDDNEAENIETEPTKAPEGIEIDDPVRMYLKEIGRVPLLSAKEEVSLAERIEAGDEEARRQLVEANRKSVV